MGFMRDENPVEKKIYKNLGKSKMKVSLLKILQENYFFIYEVLEVFPYVLLNLK